MAPKTIELRSKANALTAELTEWSRCAAAGQRFEKHHSQIERIGAQITAAMTALIDEIDDATSDPWEIENRILDFHRIWDFFRAKLVLRAFDHFRDFLAVADEFAFACYQAAITAAGATKREPPLTFFSAASSPRATPRDSAYASAQQQLTFSDIDAIQLLKSLPVPIVSVPWYQQSHLPDLAIVAHEVGHHVEDDLGLADVLDAALRQIGFDSHHEAAWLSWRGEAFADVFATMAIGRAYPRALFEFLQIIDVAAMVAETNPGVKWGAYPTAPLRLALAREVLRKRETLDETTTTFLQPVAQHGMSDFEADCAKVVEAMMTAPLPNGRKVADLIAFGLSQETNVSTAAQNALMQGAIGSKQARELVAAAVIAYARSPESFHRKSGPKADGSSPHERISAQFRASLVSGVRNVPIEAQKQSVASHTNADRQRGEQLLAALRKKN